MAEQEIAEGQFILTGRHEVDYLNDKFHLNLPENIEYETLGGLIIHVHESIPEKGDAGSVVGPSCR